MKVAITGCNGRVGTRVVKLALERGHAVLGVDFAQPLPSQDPWLSNPEYSFKHADLTNFEVVLDILAGYDAVITLAACPNPGDFKVNTHNGCVIQTDVQCYSTELITAMLSSPGISFELVQS